MPIQFPVLFQNRNRPSPFDGLAETLMAAAQQRRQKQADIAAALRGEKEDARQSQQDARQGQQDFQSAYIKAQQLAQSGDLQGAHALLAPYGAQIQQRQAAEPGEWQTRLNQDEYDFADTLNKPDLEVGQAPTQGKPDDLEGLMSQSHGQSAPATAWDQLRNAAQADQAKKTRAVNFLTGKFNGHDFTLDPEAIRQQQLQRSDQAFSEAGGAGGEGGDIVRELYPQMRAAALAGGKPLDADDMMKNIQGEGRLRSQQAAADAREAQAQARMELQERLRMAGIEQSDLNNRRMTAAILGGAKIRNDGETKADTNNRADAANLERATKDIFTMADGKQLLKSDRALHAAITNISAKGPDAVMSHKDAFMQLERYFRGATPTDSETELLLKNMGGIPGAVDQYLADVKSGDFSDFTKRNIASAAQRAKQESEENVRGVMSALNDRLGPGSEFSNMGPQVNRQIRAIGRLYGLEVPSLYPDDGRPGAVLGSGERSRDVKPKPTPAGGKPDLSKYRNMVRGGGP